MSEGCGRTARLVFIALLCMFWADLALAQLVLPPEQVPPKFTADAEFAARVRALLLPRTKAATGRYAVGHEVMQELVRQIAARGTKFAWDLRIAPDAGNVFASPDGTIFVDEGLARILGSQSGLWGAALSHEIAHVVRRDWARRYLFQKSMEESGSSQIMLGGGGSSGSWVDARTSSSLFANFCQAMEVEADAESLMLMARAGFHPDYVPALHHLLQAQHGQFDGQFVDSSHPRWGEREESLQESYVAAGKEYDRLWPDRHASPGGNPPIVVYAGLPSAKQGSSGKQEVRIPLHCDNLSGSVEVAFHLAGAGSEFPSELHQFTGCTSNRTFITFALPHSDTRRRSRVEGEISVLDDSGAILTRSLASTPIR
jgi:Zn-dependent protease with chaperone function